MAKRGRPEGAEIDDTAILRKMAREKMQHPELKIQTIAKQFEHLAEGAFGPESAARYKRLAGKFRKRRAELMAWAETNPAD